MDRQCSLLLCRLSTQRSSVLLLHSRGLRRQLRKLILADLASIFQLQRQLTNGRNSIMLPYDLLFSKATIRTYFSSTSSRSSDPPYISQDLCSTEEYM